MARTLGALCDIAPHEQFGGRDLFGEPAPERVYSTIGYGLPESSSFANLGRGRWPDGSGWPRRACVRTDRFRLDMNVRRNGAAVPPDEEDLFLADVRQDPAELRNEAANPDYAAVVRELRDDLLARARDAVEPPFVPTFAERELGAFGTHAR
jgi:choline-sulfatase